MTLRKGMMIALLFAAFAGIQGAFAVTGNGKVERKDFNLASFTGIELKGIGSISVIEGKTQSVSVELDSNLFSYLDIKVDRDMLSVGFKPGTSITKVTKLAVYIIIPKLVYAGIFGTGDIDIGSFSGNKIKLIIDGTGDISGNLEYDSVSVEISGTGNCTLEGTADTVNYFIAGTGSIFCKNLAARSAVVNVSGAGNVELRVSAELSVFLTGAGSVTYWGSPKVSQVVMGVGSVIKGGD